MNFKLFSAQGRRGVATSSVTDTTRNRNIDMGIVIIIIIIMLRTHAVSVGVVLIGSTEGNK